MTALIKQTREINHLLQESEKVDYNKVTKLLSEFMAANVYLVDKEGVILGYALQQEFECGVILEDVLEQGQFPEEYVKILRRVRETSSNIRLQDGNCVLSEQLQCPIDEKYSLVVPVVGIGKRLGSLVIAKFHAEFTEQDLVLAEYGATMLGMGLLRGSVDKLEEEMRKRTIVQVALNTLSYSELEAAMIIMDELNGNEDLIVASKIADREKITRSVIVNALRKLESAGVIESKSLGMKGTNIRILNEQLIGELNKKKH
ncbi:MULTISPECIES: GTP-sensing pleiotropic transcriptional regulator CodY [Sporomusa]|uniref:Global transcriptional regulator CodY n=2 Tax=Sporomusa TaxID=2375 RepID=A0ABM9W003_9FIRM|nr:MULTISPECIES: GTP-sensing pleiotropic transcriptional regulator CodY [Sporomusa]OLS57004.1 GTP-sensing transcriptional pleiotropic repressor CodY [Sporomusa sphaeroides DSM 2875]CVK18190.1 GTP-sensing transcriptional pleiotropic repressor CodY [Sporomusa sphaeroides DSM 2875]SCM81717.1 GTP-sensing transcriptional pleiotropic repressor CodY [uncultured Sporomusa sp.]HML31941.1 GTP-sensing pleiotropic transcriptional regulator CodY [Sporomusa sphaeroides]